jgi:hypothetical protein
MSLSVGFSGLLSKMGKLWNVARSVWMGNDLNTFVGQQKSVIAAGTVNHSLNSSFRIRMVSSGFLTAWPMVRGSL